jgi:hypothetical protein
MLKKSLQIFKADKKSWEKLIACFSWYDWGHFENDASNNSSIVVCIRYRGNVSTVPLPGNGRGIFTEPLPSNDKGIFIQPLPSNDEGNFAEPLPSNDKGLLPSRCLATVGEYTDTHTDSNVISLAYFYFFKISKLG